MKLSASDAYVVISRAVMEQGSASFRATGTSMLPFVHPGDIVTIEGRDSYRRDDIVLAREHGTGRVVLHAVVERIPIGYSLMGTANLRQTESCTPSDIAGVVVEVCRDGRTRSMSSRRHKAAMELWRVMLPLRRVLMFVYRNTRCR